mgnify:CR=1 FL=1|jgi:hypothetical protein
MATNMTAACLDPSEAFRSVHTLSHCFQIFGHQDNDFLSSDDYKSLFVYSNDTFGLMIDDCMKQYCLKPDAELLGCAGNSSFVNSPGIGLSTLLDPYSYGMVISPFPHFMASGCDFVKLDLNEDISGSGEILSYRPLNLDFRKPHD